MVRVYLDEQLVECEVAGATTIGELIERVRGTVVVADRLVVGVCADGADLAGESFANTLGLHADAFARYDFTTGNVSGVVLDALAAGEALLARAEEMRPQVINRLTQGQAAEGMAALGECCNAWRRVHETISDALHLLKLDAARLGLAGSLADMKPPLTQIRAALDAHDLVLVCDVLQYEFEPVIENWRRFIDALRRAAEPMHSDST